MTAPDVLALSAVIAIVAPLVAAGGKSLADRRRSSGRINTTEAGDLWRAAQNLITSLQTENAKLISQRDTLVAAFERILPTLDGIVATQRKDGETLALILSLLEGDARAPHGAPAAPGSPG